MLKVARFGAVLTVAVVVLHWLSFLSALVVPVSVLGLLTCRPSLFKVWAHCDNHILNVAAFGAALKITAGCAYVHHHWMWEGLHELNKIWLGAPSWDVVGYLPFYYHV